MIINGNKVPYVEVAYEFARNPSRYSYDFRQRRLGGASIDNKRIEPLELSIPVIYSRRDTEKTWDEIKEELAEFLYNAGESKISFSLGDDKYYKAQVMSVEIAEEHEYAARGNILIVGSDSYRRGDVVTLNLTPTKQTFTIKGQAETPWRSKTTFTEPANQFTLESNSWGLIINSNFIVGDTLEIDYKTRDILLNGENIDVGLSLDSEWFILDAGTMELSASHPTDLTYTERYY